MTPTEAVRDGRKPLDDRARGAGAVRLPGLIAGFVVTLITLIGASAMAGAVGAGGLGASPSAMATSASRRR